MRLCVCLFQEATGGRGVDVIVEMLSNVNLSKDLQMLAYGGRVTVSTSTFCASVALYYSTVSILQLRFFIIRCLKRVLTV